MRLLCLCSAVLTILHCSSICGASCDCPGGIQFSFEPATGKVLVCNGHAGNGCSCDLGRRLQDLLSDSDTSIGVFLKITTEQICSWMTQVPIQGQEQLKQSLKELLARNCHGINLIFRPSPIPDGLCVAERYKYLMTHLPIGNWFPHYLCIVKTPLNDLFERFSYVLSGRLYYLSPDKTENPDNPDNFIKELGDAKERAQASFDGIKAKILKKSPNLEDVFEKLEDCEDMTLEKVMKLSRAQGLQVHSAKCSMQHLYSLNAFAQQLNVHITLLEEAIEKQDSIFCVVRKVISRFNPNQIQKVSGRYLKLLEEIIQIKPLIEPETAAWAMQYPGGIRSVIKVFD